MKGLVHRRAIPLSSTFREAKAFARRGVSLGVVACLMGCGGRLAEGEGGDGGAPVDAGVVWEGGEGQTGLDGQASPFCEGRAVDFCEDFQGNDGDGAVGARWDARAITPGASLTVDDDGDGRRSLRALTPAAADGELGRALLRKTVAGIHDRVRFAFDVRPDDGVGTLGPVAVATLDLSLAHLLTFYLRDDDASPAPAVVEVRSDGTTRRHSLSRAPTPSRYTRVTLEVDGKLGSFVIRYDDAVEDLFSVEQGAIEDPTIRVGLLATGPTTVREARFDDVEVVVQ